MSKNKILVSGGGGHFAKCLSRLDKNIITLSKEKMDVQYYTNILEQIVRHKPKYFIHAGAMTRPISKHEQNPGQSIGNNIIGTCHVVLACMHYNIKLIYISTDYVYPGTQGNYAEDDPVLPFTKYGWSKLGGECAVQMYDNSLIIRTGMCNKPFPHKKAVCDNRKSLMWDEDVAKITLRLLNETGVINVGDMPLSYYDFAKNNDLEVDPIYIKDIDNKSMATDCSLNIVKMRRALQSQVKN